MNERKPTTMAQDNDNPDEAADFGDFVAAFADGKLNERLSVRFRELVAACRETGKKGSMVIKIGVKPEGTMAGVTFESKVTKPEHAVPGQLFYAGEDGELTTEDPRQLKLPGKIIHAGGIPRIVPRGGSGNDDGNDKH